MGGGQSQVPPVVVFGIGDIYPVTAGGQKAVYCLYGALSQLQPCRYVFLDPSGDGRSEGAYPNGLEFVRIGGRSARSWRNGLVAPKFRYRDGPTRNLLRTARTPAVVRQFMEEAERASALIFTFPTMWTVLGSQVKRQRVVYDSHNFELQLARERLAVGALDTRCLAVQRDTEASLSQRADLLLACSPIDTKAFVGEFGISPHKIHTGFKGASVPTMLPPQRSANVPVATFVGSDWPANNEAALIVALQIAPRLPNVHFRVIGSCCHALPTKLPPNVEAAGFVGDLEQELLSTTVALNPIRSGSGINMKLLEYLALGIPIVTTEFGVRGLEAAAMPAMEMATIDAFPVAIEKLLGDPLRLRRMRVHGHEFAREHLDWPVLAGRLAELLAT